jgi:NAD(P)-dependent dehydrogenase (short-subunit alcohol dehydrogenase family)
VELQMTVDEQPRVIDVRGVRVLVTAGADGIGKVIAGAFANAGARVHITDIAEGSIAQTISDLPGLSATCGDASVAGDADRVVLDIARNLGGLDVLINNAGIAGPTGGIETYADADVDRTIDVNLKSQFYFLSRCVPLLKASTRAPSIVAMSSVAGRLGYAYRTPYAATKWAIVGIVKSLAAELGPEGIRVNAILPGAVSGPRMDGVIADRAAVLGLSIEDMRKEYVARISLRRMVDAEDVANLALFLSSRLARNITGQAISVDGNAEHI